MSFGHKNVEENRDHTIFFFYFNSFGLYQGCLFNCKLEKDKVKCNITQI